MATTNYTAITTEKINASLGRNTFYGKQGTVYLSKYSDYSFMTNAGEVILLNSGGRSAYSHVGYSGASLNHSCSSSLVSRLFAQHIWRGAFD